MSNASAWANAAVFNKTLDAENPLLSYSLEVNLMLLTYRLAGGCFIMLAFLCFTGCSRVRPAAKTPPPAQVPLVAVELGLDELPDANVAREQLRRGEKIEHP